MDDHKDIFYFSPNLLKDMRLPCCYKEEDLMFCQLKMKNVCFYLTEKSIKVQKL